MAAIAHERDEARAALKNLQVQSEKNTRALVDRARTAVLAGAEKKVAQARADAAAAAHARRLAVEQEAAARAEADEAKRAQREAAEREAVAPADADEAKRMLRAAAERDAARGRTVNHSPVQTLLIGGGSGGYAAKEISKLQVCF